MNNSKPLSMFWISFYLAKWWSIIAHSSLEQEALGLVFWSFMFENENKGFNNSHSRRRATVGGGGGGGGGGFSRKKVFTKMFLLFLI